MRLFITTAVAALALAGVASAQEAKPAAKAPAVLSGQYVSIAGGVIGSTDFDYDYAGPTVSSEADAGGQGVIAWGASLGPNWRAELAGGYRSQKLETTYSGGTLQATWDGGKAQVISVDINAYYDFPVKGKVKPYLGAGIGVASVKIDDGILDDRGDALTLQAIAGASFEVSPNVSLFAEGRYQRVGPVKVEITSGSSKTESDFDLSSFGGLVGVRFSF